MRKVTVFVTLLLGGCVMRHPTIRPLRPLEIATAPYVDVATDTHTGSLMYEGGCLLFRDDATRALLMPIWPAGSSFNGTAVSFHLPGKSDQWLAITQEIQIQGEPLRWNALDQVYYAPEHRQCGLFPPYLVTSVRPAD